MKHFFTVAFFLISSFLLSQEKGNASFYHDKYSGRKTSDGSIFSQNKYTCASGAKYKLGTKLEITNPHTNKSVIVTVTDRGKDIVGNRIDLSKIAFKEIADLRQGIVKILIKKLQD